MYLSNKTKDKKINNCRESQESTTTNLEEINNCNKVVEYKVNIQQSIISYINQQ